MARRPPLAMDPWEQSLEDDRRFGRLLKIGVAALAIVGLILPFIPVP